MARDERLEVKVPDPIEDKPRLARVGIVAGVGFVLGIVWPWLAGVELVPRAPSEQGPAKLSAPQPQPTGSAQPSAAPPAAPATASKQDQEDSAADRIKLGEARITSCRDAKGNQFDKCDAIKFDNVAKARLKALAGCRGAQGAHGMLSIGFELDFAKQKVVRLLRGMSTTLPDRTTEALLKCARKEFETASLTGMEHGHESYTVFYLAEFLPPGKKATDDDPEAEGKGDETTAASGMATVTWNVAIIRESPSTDSARVARILSGTRVAIVGRRNNWYKVKYDAKGNEGWVYKSAVGL